MITPSDPRRLGAPAPLSSPALGEGEPFFRAILESLDEGVVIADAEDRILYVNAKMEEIAQRPRAAMLGQRSVELLIPEEDRPRFRERHRERLQGRSETYELEQLLPDGRRRWIRVSSSPLSTAEGKIVGRVALLTSIDELRALTLENVYLRDAVRAPSAHILGGSPAIRKVFDQISLVAPTDATVLITGESGTGKELVAHAIHEASARRGKPLIKVNCPSIPKELFESEFFGHLRGAFTGALKDRVGRFELADHGTLFLDEVSEIPLELQAKLLRVLQEQEFERVGEGRTRSVDVRVIAATNRDLTAAVRDGRFRGDLYFRLNVFPITLPPLRERSGDVALLARHFLETAARHLGRPVPVLGEAEIRALTSYDWPGNVRELKNVIERTAILAQRGPFRLDLPAIAPAPGPPTPGPGAAPPSREWKAQERGILEAALTATNWKIYGTDGAAVRLGLPPTTVASKMKRLGLKRPR
jgi:PAS domain S-box-containing protein